MSNELKKLVQKAQQPDGRNVETHIEEVEVGDHSERITTVFEERLHLDMAKKVIEKVVPVVAARTTEEYDINGMVKLTLVEKVPEDALKANLSPVKLKTSSVTSPQHVVAAVPPQTNSAEHQNFITKEELTSVLKDFASELTKQNLLNAPQQQVVKRVVCENKPADKVENNNWFSNLNWGTIFNYVLWVVLAGLAAHVGYMMFIK